MDLRHSQDMDLRHSMPWKDSTAARAWKDKFGKGKLLLLGDSIAKELNNYIKKHHSAMPLAPVQGFPGKVVVDVAAMISPVRGADRRPIGQWKEKLQADARQAAVIVVCAGTNDMHVSDPRGLAAVIDNNLLGPINAAAPTAIKIVLAPEVKLAREKRPFPGQSKVFDLRALTDQLAAHAAVRDFLCVGSLATGVEIEVCECACANAHGTWWCGCETPP